MKQPFKYIYGFVGLWIVASLLGASSVEARRHHRPRYTGLSARAAILADADGQPRYFAKNIFGRVLPASTTKVMTALLVLERLSLDADVAVSERATSVQPSKINLRPGEHYKVKDLLFALLLNSANDASVALAEAVSGTEGDFVRLMNERCRQLGAVNTRFANSHGLPSPAGTQYTTAYDMFLIFREALKKYPFDIIIKYRYKTIYSAEGRKILLRSHNKILFNEWERKVYGKTGYTRSAKQCFIGMVPKGEKILIIGVFGCSARWNDIKYLVSRYGKVSL
ncbi:MAG: D-alanyl-D-alanine carboxypeptidase [Candidatus Omnitrophica bacterium]|nr:D-alanyl-D-alanine carboxypeptidase [Candidatus Omnitrophota bacterium]